MACPLNHLELLLHELLIPACLVAVVSARLQQSKLLLAQLLTSFVVLCNLAHNLLLLVLVCTHNALNSVQLLLSGKILLLLLKCQIVMTTFGLLLKLDFLLVANSLNPALPVLFARDVLF